ncbi:MAG: metallophosphoesterase [Balneolaceae bacterium]|nr:metallophosphoesterase [Balneolaceae bacterium]MDR9446740.1 metallophosphoesterase [Balneolaceae bacterium]
MKRKTFLSSVVSSMGLLATSSLLPEKVFGVDQQSSTQGTPVLRILHMTDVHITPEASPRFKALIRHILANHQIDFVLNGGDSIMAADYSDITEERVDNLWAAWHDCIKEFGNREIHSVIGNHDPWWASPDKSHEKYGKDYVVKQLAVPNTYYSFDRNGWHFIMLDGNHEGISLGDEQMEWLEGELAALEPGTPTLCMSHYPALGVGPHFVGGLHKDFKELKNLFYKYRDCVRGFLSGHNHLDDYAVYNGVQYCCNGSISGFWWGEGDDASAGPYYYLETPPGYAIIECYSDGSFTNQYIPHTF